MEPQLFAGMAPFENPEATASLALGQRIVNRIIKAFFGCQLNDEAHIYNVK